MKIISIFAHEVPVRIVAALLGGIVIVVVLGWFVWPGPAMRAEKNLKVVEGYFNTNDLDGAISKLDEALLQDPNNVDFLIAKAIAVAQKGSVTFQEKIFGAQAAALAQQAISIDPTNSKAYRALGYAYEIQQNYPKAHESYQRAVQLDGNNVVAIFGDGHSYDLEGDMVKAEERYTAALRIDGTFDQAYVGLARVAMQKGNFDQAIQMYQKSIDYSQNIRIKSESATAIALLYLGKPNVEKALQYSAQAVEADAKYSSAWLAQGTAEFVDSFNKKKYPEPSARGEMINKSLQDLKKAALLNPNQAAVYLQIGTELSAIGQANGAAAIFKKGLEVVEKDITLGAADRISMRAKLLKARELMVKVEAVRNKKSTPLKN